MGDRDCICRSCGSSNVQKLDAIAKLRTPSFDRPEKPLVSALVEVVFCLDCRKAQSIPSATDVKLLREATAKALTKSGVTPVRLTGS